tara:strand:+ start:127 stop:828 length:702 start_codon:yes stop_codon:yes gene_type:complete
MAQKDCCGFKYYDQAGIDADPEKKKTDTFVRFLLCNQKSIQGLYNAWYLSRQLPSYGYYYCYRYFNIFKNLPLGKECYDKSVTESKVYQSTRIFLFWEIALKMRDDKEYNDKILAEREVTVFNQFSKELETIKLDDLDIQVLLLLKLRKKIEQLYVRGNLAYDYVSMGKFWCITVKFGHDLCGRKLKTINYNGKALKELFLCFSANFRGLTSPTGKKCLLNRCKEPIVKCEQC